MVGRDEQLHGSAALLACLEADVCEAGLGAVGLCETVCCCSAGMLGKVAVLWRKRVKGNGAAVAYAGTANTGSSQLSGATFFFLRASVHAF